MFNRISLLIFVSTLLITLLCFRGCSAAEPYNGFKLNNLTIPAEQIYAGGPAKDGIPSIDAPRFKAIRDTTELDENDLLLSVEFNGLVKAYPLAIMNWHELVNDNFNERTVLVSYCPLCGTGIAYQLEGKTEFGVSGLLYNSDVLLYDRKTESLWSQIMSRAISGPRSGEKLQQIPTELMSWQSWRHRYPQGVVLSRKTGFSRDYDSNPYQGYETSSSLYFPVNFLNQGYHPKERVLGIELDGRFKAYPFSELAQLTGDQLRDSFQGKELLIRFNATERSGRVALQPQGVVLSAVNAYWFAWFAFHPETEVYKAP